MRWKPKAPNVIRQRYGIRDAMREHHFPGGFTLNIGSRESRTEGGVDIDIVRHPGVDVQADAHHLPFADGSFDAVILSAVLQYCRHPDRVVSEAERVLRPGGWVFVNAPFVQPYCPDGKDLWRFSRDGLLALFDRFNVLSCRVCIPVGSALAHCAYASTGTNLSSIADKALRFAVGHALRPLRWWHTDDHRSAGAFVLAART